MKPIQFTQRFDYFRDQNPKDYCQRNEVTNKSNYSILT